ncbi:MAG: hypothetical protein GC181_07875 [Bacteroidetes bacterium]|nr:hypothetical protein [Bacteroidota bacterium]
MKRYFVIKLMFWSAIIFSGSSFAQDKKDAGQSVTIDIPEVALLDLESSSGTSIVLNIEAPKEAGQPVSFASAVDSSIWINYSSIAGNGKSAKRDISAKIISGKLPSYFDLNVVAASDAGAGDGTMGTPSGAIKLTNGNQKIIRNIGSCYTGDGAGKGHALYYALSLKNGSNRYRQIDFDDATTITVLYTISD